MKIIRFFIIIGLTLTITVSSALVCFANNYPYTVVGRVGCTTGTSGPDAPTYSNIGDIYIWDSSENIKYSKSLTGEKITLAKKSGKYSSGIRNVISNGKKVYYQEYFWKTQKNTIKSVTISGKKKTVFSTKQNIILSGVDGNKIFYTVTKYKKGKTRHSIKRYNINTKKHKTLISGYESYRSSCGKYLVCQKDGDGYINDYQMGYYFDTSKNKMHKLPIKDCYTIATKDGLYCNYYGNHNVGSQLRHYSYSGKLIETILTCDMILWLSQTAAGYCMTEDDYINGINYSIDYKNKNVVRLRNLWDE